MGLDSRNQRVLAYFQRHPEELCSLVEGRYFMDGGVVVRFNQDCELIAEKCHEPGCDQAATRLLHCGILPERLLCDEHWVD